MIDKDEWMLLQQQIELLKNAEKILSYSFSACQEIGLKEKYSYEELDKYEALTSRFARTSDILIQKIFRLLDEIELEAEGSIIDRIQRAEKKGIIQSAEKFKHIRRLRNEIAHEYIPEAMKEIFSRVIELTPELIRSVGLIELYISSKYGDNPNNKTST